MAELAGLAGRAPARSHTRYRCQRSVQLGALCAGLHKATSHVHQVISTAAARPQVMYPAGTASSLLSFACMGPYACVCRLPGDARHPDDSSKGRSPRIVQECMHSVIRITKWRAHLLGSRTRSGRPANATRPPLLGVLLLRAKPTAPRWAPRAYFA